MDGRNGSLDYIIFEFVSTCRHAKELRGRPTGIRSWETELKIIDGHEKSKRGLKPRQRGESRRSPVTKSISIPHELPLKILRRTFVDGLLHRPAHDVDGNKHT